MFKKFNNIYIDDMYKEYQEIVSENDKEAYVFMASEYKRMQKRFSHICLFVFALLITIPIIMIYLPYPFVWWHYTLVILAILVILGNCSDYEKRQYHKYIVCSMIHDSYEEWAKMDKTEKYHTIKAIVKDIKSKDKWFR